MVILTWIFWGNFTLFSIVVLPIYILTNSAKEFSFLHILANICCLFLLMAVLTMWGSTVVWIGFPWWLLFLHIFSYIHWPFVCLLGKKLVRVLCSLFNWVIWRILLLSDMSSLYIADSSPLSDQQFSNLFSYSLVASSLYSPFLLLCRFLDWCCSTYLFLLCCILYPKIHCKDQWQAAFPLIYSRSFILFRSYTKVFNPFWDKFCE